MITRVLLVGCVVLLAVVLGVWSSGMGDAREGPPTVLERTVGAAPAAAPAARFGHSMVTISNTVYLFGGTDTASAAGIAQVVALAGGLLNDLWKFSKDNWTEETPTTSPPARYSHAATAYGGKMYIFGGVGASGNILNDAWAYDPRHQDLGPALATGPAPRSALPAQRSLHR